MVVLAQRGRCAPGRGVGRNVVASDAGEDLPLNPELSWQFSSLRSSLCNLCASERLGQRFGSIELAAPRARVALPHRQLFPHGVGWRGASRADWGDMSEFDVHRGFSGSAPGQNLTGVLERLTSRDLELIVGPRVLPLLPRSDKIARSVLATAALRAVSDRPLEIFKDPTLRRTLLRNLDAGKADELRHRLKLGGVEPDFDTLTAPKNWPIVAGFLGLEPEEAAPAAASMVREPLEGAFTLFPHQRSVVRRAYGRIGSGDGRTLIHMPTGAGKTRTAMHLVSRTLNEQEPAVLVWLAVSRELLEQAAEAFQAAWSSLGNRQVTLHRFWGSRADSPSDLTDGLLVAGLAKMHAWRTRDPVEFLKFSARARLVVVDEAHQAIAPTYRGVIEGLSAAGQHHAIVGLTATPGRTWNDVAADQALSDFFEGSKVVLEAGSDANPVKYLLDEGYLARPSFQQIDYSPEITPTSAELRRLAGSDDFTDETLNKMAADVARNMAIIKSVQELVARGHKRIILFAISVQHAEDLSTALTAHGLQAAVVSGTTPPNRRSAIIKAFKAPSPSPLLLCNFGVLTTGFDAPRTSAAVIARPTKSLVLFSQMVGRATRGPKANGNEHCEILTVHDPAYPGFGDIAEAFFNWEDVWHDD